MNNTPENSDKLLGGFFDHKIIPALKAFGLKPEMGTWFGKYRVIGWIGQDPKIGKQNYMTLYQ